MAVQYIPNNPSTPLPLPVRRSTRHIALPPTPSSSTALTTPASSASHSAKSNRVVARSPSTRRRPRQLLATTTPSTPVTPTPTSSRSRKRPRFQDEPDQKEQDLAAESFPSTPSPRTRLPMIIAPITPEPTPRAIRAQKRRKLTDATAEPEPATASDLSSSSSSPSLSPSHSLSPTTPLPQPISPEPISPSHSHSDSASPFIVKSRPRKRKLEDNGASSIASPSSDTSTPPSGDPLPRSLTKRRKLDRTSTSRQKPPRAVRVRSKSKSSIGSGTPPTPLTSKKRSNPKLRPSRARTSVSLPRGGNNNHRTNDVRRSARLLVHTGDESQHKYPSDAQLEESLPLSPLTPPPSEGDPSESSQLTNEQHADFTSSSVKPLADEEDDTEMEMIACIGGIPTASSATCPSAAHTPLSPSTSWKSIIPSHISNPVLKGRPPPNPALYTQLQLASYRRTKPNTPSPLSLYSYTGVTPPTSPALSAVAINSLDAIDDIPSLGEAAAVEAIGVIAEGSASVGLPDQLFHEQQQPHIPFYGQGYSQVESQQQSLPGQSFEQPLQQPPATVASSASSPNPPPPLDMNFMMIDLQLQMQLQHMGMPGSASEGMHFGEIGFMMGHAVEERNDRIPATVHMQDVHLHQQPHQNQNHQQQILDVQPNQLFGYPYFSAEQQGQIQQDSNHLYGTQEYGGESQSFQEPEYQQQRQFQDQQQPEYPHHQEQPQTANSYEAYGGIQPYQSGSPQVYDQQRPHQQDFQAQQQQLGGDGVPPFSSSNLNVGYDASAYQKQTQTSPSTPVAPPTTSATAVASSGSVHAAATIPHYTLSMHNALLFFQQSHSRFHEDQHMLAADAVEIHSRQLEEFQREKEDRKRRLKRTKLVREVQVVPMGSSAAALGSAPGIGVGACSGVGRARGLWAVACKARMFEVVRIYTPALIREVTEISAREYYHRMGLKYPCRFALSLYRRRVRRREDDISVSEDDPLVDRDGGQEQEGGDVEADSDEVFDVLSSLEKKDDGDADGEEFRKEKIFDFELLDDDEEDEEVMDEARKLDEETDDDEDEDGDEDDGDDGDDDEAPESGVDLDFEAIRDPFFQPELSMRITPQAPIPSISGGIETTFYVPPPEVHAIFEQNSPLCEEQAQDPDSEARAAATSPNGNSTATSKQNQKQKFMLFHRPVLPLPPPALSTFRPTALRFYNVDPVHAGRGTPCVKERREMWAGVPKVPSLSISVQQFRRIKGCDDGTSGDVASDVNAWYVEAGEGQVATARDLSSSTSSAPHSDVCSIPPHTEKDDSVFGDCVGVCCMNENTKGKMKTVGVEVEEQEVEGGRVGERRLEEELQRGEEEAHGDDDGPSSTSAALPQHSIAQPPPPQPSQHMTVEIPPVHPDRIPHRRRGVIGRTELLKVYAPPPRLVPSILPLARRPPRPPPLSLGLGLEETETARSLATPQTYHHPVVPYSWEQVSEAMEVLAYQGVDASVWMDRHGHPPSPLSPCPLSPNGISGTEVQIQPTFNPSSSELSSALG